MSCIIWFIGLVKFFWNEIGELGLIVFFFLVSVLKKLIMLMDLLVV